MTSSDTQIRRPGFGLALNWRPDTFFFPNAVTDWAPLEITVRERSMLAAMNDLTDKADWRRKVFDDTIVARWREEALTYDGQGFTKEMFDFCISELRDKASRHEESGMVAVLDGHAAVIKSDSAVSPELTQALRAAVRPLESVPERAIDWHPGSDHKVLDLVHPSLFPLVYGLTRILPDREIGLRECLRSTGLGVVADVPPEDEARATLCYTSMKTPALWSTRFQWLPAEVRFVDGGSGVKFTSYVNNLHPVHHRALYTVLEDLVAKAVPLWSLALAYVQHGQEMRERDLRIPCLQGAEYNWTYTDYPPRGSQESGGYAWESDESDDDENYERELVLPKPRAYTARAEPAFDLRAAFAEQGLQVIVKLANIVLTPDRPRYDGGTWHVEGQLNERICASALYYYDCENVTDSYLAFRERISWESLPGKPYEQYESDDIEYLYGVENYGPAMQDVGRVHTRAGRLLAFPNVFQHRVQPFELADAARPGHRKIVALFLVDPHQRITSTAQVPPQQREWWAEALRADGGMRLPEELFQLVVDDVEGFPIGLGEARAARAELMQERAVYDVEVQNTFDELTLSFCEH